MMENSIVLEKSCLGISSGNESRNAVIGPQKKLLFFIFCFLNQIKSNKGKWNGDKPLWKH